MILFNGFQKKSQKTPKNGIERATRLKQEYFSNKANYESIKRCKTFDELLGLNMVNLECLTEMNLKLGQRLL